MQQPDTDSELLEPDTSTDDWGDFSAVIDALNQQENKPTEPDDTEPNKSDDKEEQSEAAAAFLDIAFVVTEQVTSMLVGFEFEFDEKGKTKVIEAAKPVLTKHSEGIFMKMLGNYFEEATLLFAIITLGYSTRKQIVKTKKLIAQQAKQDRGEGEYAEEATAVAVS
ncbi:hypothetical protein [Vibrio gazogenes]|uniref:Uncharacterized protein n=1 Tax=Vibrio gazogenes TaxID=687 RepID=A0A1Z2SBD3_VIBGA|nr:hypothetical protein [Vibrio gazogenes]ASA54427.1 hypothetical protein BSQ33_00915 [Vibrio gazogenes]ASA58368.1 hypothetical protein BSQ33_21555 [Vibrio gazogenes]